VDAGNGKVLYTSASMSINSIQFSMKEMDGMNGVNKGFGHWGPDRNQGW
jgi:hypothetical protein